MDYRYYGRTGVDVSPLCLGCMNFGGRATEEESVSIIEHALDVGINFIDTANVYGHDPQNFKFGRGRSEKIVGEALKKTGKRKETFLATKAHFPMGTGPNTWGNSRLHIMQQCEESLRRLQTDYIDLYQLHHPSSHVPIDETLRALDDLVHKGWVRYIGTSSFGAWQMVESLWVAKEYGLNRFISEQPSYHLLDRRVERELVPMAQTYGIAVIPWSPLAGGFLTGKYERGKPAPKGSRFDAFWQAARDGHLQQEKAFDILDMVIELSNEKGCSPSQIALAWCMNQPGITSPIIGPRTLVQLKDCLGALDVTITDEDRKRLDEVAPPGRATVPYYGSDGMAWTTWGPHTHRW